MSREDSHVSSYWLVGGASARVTATDHEGNVITQLTVSEDRGYIILSAQWA